ncbi:MAG TPA: D-alanyl-D-alanine carboxypeptidase family protein [Halanaerobiales bacterium]|nr:D-alanyl-D-alanine carboxypeptidase family protein [Halanaerobiales bacterium]
MKRIISLIVIVISLITLTNYNIVKANDFDVSVDSAILLEAETGEVIFEKNADKKVPPASITKIMTLLLSMEAIEEGKLNLDDKIEVSRKAESMGGSQIFLPAGVELKLEKLLEAVSMASANDASVAVAEAVGGSYNNFIAMMNERANELGMKNTNFVNSTGLPAENHYSTARDISIMARELIKHEKVLEWTSTWLDYIELPERKAMVVNTNELIKKYDGLDGLKTGHTQEAGFCLAGTAENNNMRLISVVLNGDTLKEREEATTELMDYGFNTFRKTTVVEKDKKINNIVVSNGKKTVTTGTTENEYKTLVRVGQSDNIETKVNLNKEIKAPITKGDVLGQITILKNEEKAGTVNIIAEEKIKKANILVRMWRSFGNWLNGLFS